MRQSRLEAAKIIARILGDTVSRCEKPLRAGNEAGLSTSYMVESVRLAYGNKGTKRQRGIARAILRELGETE